MVFTKTTTHAKTKFPTRVSPRIAGKVNATKGSETNQTSIKVIVRVRPPNERENQENYKTVVKVCDSHMLVFDPKVEEDPFFYRGVAQKGRDILKKQNKNLEFVFNRVFDGSSTNWDVFEGSTRDMISSLLDGYNCSVFAYGATGAGKTHTMLGKEHDPGITYLTVAELFSQIEKLKEQREFNLGVTYLEIYNENVQDLLEKKGPLFLREDSQRGVVVTGLKIITITSATELLELLTRGNKNRTQFPTDANGESSRSHAVFQVYISIRNKLDGQVKRVKLSMIDLAGSERASVTGCKGERFKEGANINRSLLALGNCINNLADGIKHIPYRDSKLTRLLKDSLGGNCQTVMIANISPSSFSYEDTYNTLRYANRAKKIKTTAKKNIISCTLSASDYASMLEEAKREIMTLKNKLQMYENGGAPKPAIMPSNTTVDKEATMKRVLGIFIDKLRDLWKKKRLLNEKILSLESSDKIMCCRMNAKNAADNRLCHLTAVLESESQDELNASGKRRVQKSLQHFEKQRDRIRADMELAWSELQKVEQELRALDKNISEKNAEEALSKDKALLASELEKTRAQQQLEHAKKISSLLQCDNSSSDNVIKTMCPIMQNYYALLNTNQLLTEDMKDEFRQLVKKLEGVRGIKWSDKALTKKEEDFYNMTVLNVERLDSALTQSAPVFNYCDSNQQEEAEDAETTEASKSLNDTFNIDTSRAVKKRALAEQNSIEKDVSPAKQARKTVTGKRNPLPGKENNKDVPKITMSIKSAEIIKRIKAEKLKSLQANAQINKLANQKITKALPSTRVPW